MGSQQDNPAKRQFCHRCSKPLRLCLCSRLKTQPLDNSIGITILQHSLEKNHPLNSTRVARLGFRNLTVVPVTDVNFTAQFTVRPVDQNRLDLVKRLDFSKTHLDLDANVELPASGDEEKLEFERTRECAAVADGGSCDVKKDLVKSLDFSQTHLVDLDDLDKRHANGVVNGECGNGSFLKHSKYHGNLSKKSKSMKIQGESLDFDHIQKGVEASFDKYRVIVSSTDVGVTIERTAKPDIGWVLDTPIGQAFTSNGFMVRKLQRKQLPGREEFEDFDEFNIVMPPGAALLFPSGKSAINLDEVDFEVKHLVVLDGTWAKAQRMYHENPWLKLLPHLKLDPGKESLYSEVRHQPKAGCLSTIESIICALKGLGSEMEGLDELLDVFESMIGDQRRCKDEKFRAKAIS